MYENIATTMASKPREPAIRAGVDRYITESPSAGMKRKGADSSAAAGAPQPETAEDDSTEPVRNTRRVLPGQSIVGDLGEGTVKVGMCVDLCA